MTPTELRKIFEKKARDLKRIEYTSLLFDNNKEDFDLVKGQRMAYNDIVKHLVELEQFQTAFTIENLRKIATEICEAQKEKFIEDFSFKGAWLHKSVMQVPNIAKDLKLESIVKKVLI